MCANGIWYPNFVHLFVILRFTSFRGYWGACVTPFDCKDRKSVV